MANYKKINQKPAINALDLSLLVPQPRLTIEDCMKYIKDFNKPFTMPTTKVNFLFIFLYFILFLIVVFLILEIEKERQRERRTKKLNKQMF